jgi:hypothetical protein
MSSYFLHQRLNICVHPSHDHLMKPLGLFEMTSLSRVFARLIHANIFSLLLAEIGIAFKA